MTEQKTIAESPPQPSRVEEAKSMAEEMVEVYKFLSTSKKVWEGMVDGKPVSYSLPPDLLIQSAIASIGIVNKDRRMDEQNNKVENADKAAFAAGKYRICPKCKGEVPERVSSRTGSTFYRCNPCGVFVDDTPDSRPPKTTPGTQQKPQEPPKGSAGKAFQSAEDSRQEQLDSVRIVMRWYIRGSPRQRGRPGTAVTSASSL